MTRWGIGRANGSLSCLVPSLRSADMLGELQPETQDDGRGLYAEATSYGTGLQGMADRLDAIGGSLEVRLDIGSGTTVVGRLPVASPGQTA